MKQVIALLIGFLPNPRMEKRIRVEKECSQLHVICWDKGDGMLGIPDSRGYTAHILSIPAAGDPLRRMGPYLRFSRQAYALLKKLSPDVVHVQGLDMLSIAHRYRKNAKKPVSLVYEVADLHRLLVEPQPSPVKKILGQYLRHQDRVLTRDCDVVAVTSPEFSRVYFDAFVPREKMLYLPNMPELAPFEGFVKKTDPSRFTVGYIGSVRYKQQMRNLLDAAQECGVSLLIAGSEPPPAQIAPLCQGRENVTWLGRFDFQTQAAELYSQCDVIYCVYDADRVNVRLALPNKLYEAVFCQLPLIVAKGTYLARVVEEWDVGLAVDHTSVAELTQALRRLKEEPGLYQHLTEQCGKRRTDISADGSRQALESCLERLRRERECL